MRLNLRVSIPLLFALVSKSSLGVDQCLTPTEPLSPGCFQADAYFQNADGGCKDLATGLVWSTAPDVGTNYYTAEDYTAEGIISHCANLEEGGKNDWRAATYTELFDVAKHGARDHLKMACTLSDNLFRASSFFMSSSKVKWFKRYVYAAVRFDPPTVAPSWFRDETAYWAGAGICVRK